MTPTPPERNNPGYTPEYKELTQAREMASELCEDSAQWIGTDGHPSVGFTLRWLAAEVRVMRLERALER